MKTIKTNDRQKKLQESLGISMDYVDQITIKPEKWKLILYSVFGLLLSFVIILNLFFFSVVKVDGHSMDPTLTSGHYVILNKHEKINRFDIVVLKERLEKNGTSKNIIKRVIGVGGDVVTVINGELYINNKRYEETYLDSKNTKTYNTNSFTITVPKGYLFVLGDNRDISKDSRVLGSFKKSSVLGVKVLGGKD